jgi:hypothetical protein
MATTTRFLGFTNGIQRLAWSGPPGTIYAHLWGGGGGYGGSDSGGGGNGTGGGYAFDSFTVVDGDVIDVAVGGPGGNGLSGARGVGGGSAGASLSSSSLLFDTRTAVAFPPVGVYFNGNWGSFLNTYGIWEAGSDGFVNFERTYAVNFSTTGLYTFTFSVDNYGDVTVDGTTVISLSGNSRENYTRSYQTTVNISAGTRSVRVRGVNTSGPGSIAVTITGGATLSGGRGGNPGPSGFSGGGGGGGGATGILLNNTLLSAAGGGGGGGGGGRFSAGQSAPGTAGQANAGVYAGQDGQDHPGDGGGGGGGGGGWSGGNGGAIGGGDVGALAGSFGLGLAPIENPTGVNPGGRSNQYFASGVAQGASASQPATAGYAAIVIETTGINVHNGGQFIPVQQTYINNAGTWQPVQSLYVKDGDIWKPVAGSLPPVFGLVPDTIGVNSRPFS